MRKEKVDLLDKSQDEIRLEEAKREEKKKRRKLKRVPIHNGYVLAINPSKWNQHDTRIKK